MILFGLWQSLVDRHVERAFRARPDGMMAFYPYGSLSQGFLIQNAAQGERARAVMRSYVRRYLGLALSWCLACLAMGALLQATFLIPALHEEAIRPLSPVLGVMLMIGNLVVVLGIASSRRHRFQALRQELAVLPPAFVQWRWVRSAARRQRRSLLKVSAAAGVVIAAVSLALLLVWLPYLGRMGTVVLAGIVVAGLCFYVWCRLVMATMAVAGETSKQCD